MQFIEGQGLDQVLAELRLMRQKRRSRSDTRGELSKNPSSQFAGEDERAVGNPPFAHANRFAIVDDGTLAEGLTASFFREFSSRGNP